MPQILNPDGLASIMPWSKFRVLVNKKVVNRVTAVNTVRSADLSAGKAVIKVMDYNQQAYNSMAVGDELEAYMSKTGITGTNTGAKTWGGYIADKSFSSQNSRLLVITAKEYSQKLMEITTPNTLTASENSFTTTEVGSIIVALMNKYQTEFTTDNVLTGTANTLSVDFQGKNLFDCIKQLCDAFDYVFYVDLNKDLHVQRRSTVTTTSDALTWGTNIFDLAVSQNKEFLVNDLLVFGYTSSISGYTTDANSILQYKLHSRIIVRPAITDSTSAQSYADNYVAQYKDPIQMIVSKSRWLIDSSPLQYIQVTSPPHSLDATYQIREIIQNYDKSGIYTQMTLSQKVLDLSMLVGHTNTNVQAAQVENIQPPATSPGNVPVGGVVAWLKSYTNTPALPSGFVECNGQTLSDADSVYNGQVIPNLNGSGGGTQRFLRGATTSGTTGGEDTHTLTEGEIPSHTHIQYGNVSTAGNNFVSLTGQNAAINGNNTGATGGGSAHENRPPFYEIVWVMRIK